MGSILLPKDNDKQQMAAKNLLKAKRPTFRANENPRSFVQPQFWVCGDEAEGSESSETWTQTGPMACYSSAGELNIIPEKSLEIMDFSG